MSVDQNGDRMDNPAIVHDINVLTVVASESYKNFVANLQENQRFALGTSAKSRRFLLTGKTITTETGTVEITPVMAKQIYRYLVKNDYSDDADQVARPITAKAAGDLAPLPPELAPHAEQIFRLIDSVFSESQLPDVGDERKSKTNPLNENFEKRSFRSSGIASIGRPSIGSSSTQVNSSANASVHSIRSFGLRRCSTPSSPASRRTRLPTRNSKWAKGSSSKKQR